jgi:hypothetical protein
MNLTITKIQIEGNNVVSFLNGTDYQIGMSQVMPQVPTYISYGYDTITITQDGSKSFQFTVYSVTEVGGNVFNALNSTNTAAEVQAKTVEIYKLLVTSIFKGCCECGNTEPECSIQYVYGNGTDSGTIFYDGGGAIRVSYTTANNQDFTGFWPIIQDGSWIFIFSKTDPTVFGIYQLSNYSDGGPGVYAQFDATLIAGPSSFVDGTQVCVDVTSVGGNLIQTWQETLVTGSVLDQNNTIDGGGFDLLFDNNLSFTANVTSGSVTANSTGVSITSGGQTVEVTPTYVDIITPNHGTATTGMVLALDASGHVEYVSAGTGSGTVTSIDVDGGTGISVSPAGPITTSGTFTVTNTAPDQVVSLSSGTGISTSGTYPNFTITNSAPDQTVVLTDGTGITTSGTYPNFTITNSAPDQTVSLGTTGTGLAVTGTYPNFTLQNTLPDQTVSLTAGSGISVTGTYPSFTIAATGGGGGSIPFGTASGTDTYTVTIGTVSSYTDGDAYIIRFTNGNTNAATLNINGIGAKSLFRNNDGPLIGGDIWDGGEMLCVYNAVNDGFDCIGTSPNSLFAYITNDEAITITRGQAVYAFGGTGNRMTVKLARANTDSTSAQTIGFVFSTSIAANQKGIIIIQGYFTDLSLFPPSSGWVDGDTVYLSPTTAGAVTRIKPYAPDHLVYLGVVATASPGAAGRMYVRVQNGYELDELHNVQAQSPTVNDVLYYFGGTPGQWKTASISTVLGYTPQAQLNGTGFVKASGTTISYDNTTYAPLASPALTGTPTAPTASSGDNSTTIATTAFVQSTISGGASVPAYTMKANNTGASAVATDQTFRFPGNQSLGSNPVQTSAGLWGAGSYYYNWNRIGNMVHYTFQFIVTTPLAITYVNWDLPADMPSPLVPSGFGTANVWLIRNFVTMVTTTTATTQTTFSGGLRVKATSPSTTFDFYFSGTSGSYKTVTYSGTYFTS